MQLWISDQSLGCQEACHVQHRLTATLTGHVARLLGGCSKASKLHDRLDERCRIYREGPLMKAESEDMQLLETAGTQSARSCVERLGPRGVTRVQQGRSPGIPNAMYTGHLSESHAMPCRKT